MFGLANFSSALIAIFVYLLGGCAYQRSVMHQRGWRQCPNYSMWSDLLGVFKVSLRWCRPLLE
jgi:hypothetical protein